jgi:hypothetical protein
MTNDYLNYAIYDRLCARVRPFVDGSANGAGYVNRIEDDGSPHRTLSGLHIQSRRRTPAWEVAYALNDAHRDALSQSLTCYAVTARALLTDLVDHAWPHGEMLYNPVLGGSQPVRPLPESALDTAATLILDAMGLDDTVASTVVLRKIFSALFDIKNEAARQLLDAIRAAEILHREEVPA